MFPLVALPLATKILLGIMVAGTGAQTVANISKSQKEKKYLSDVEKAEEMEKQRREREARREAIQRALKSDVITRPADMYRPPAAPDTTEMDTIGAIGGTAANLGSMALPYLQPSEAEILSQGGMKGAASKSFRDFRIKPRTYSDFSSIG